MPRIVATGPVEETLGYLAIGAELREARGQRELEEALHELARDRSVAVVLVPESCAEAARSGLEEFRRRSPAALVVLPTAGGSKGLALAEMKSFVEQAVGVDLISRG